MEAVSQFLYFQDWPGFWTSIPYWDFSLKCIQHVVHHTDLFLPLVFYIPLDVGKATVCKPSGKQETGVALDANVKEILMCQYHSIEEY